MPMDRLPEPGAWFETEDGETFQVIALDQTAGTIDIRYADGSADQLTLDIWRDMEVAEIESPQNWHGSMDEPMSDREGPIKEE